MYTLILTITMYGWFWDDTRTVSIDNFKTQKSCEIAGEKLKGEHSKTLTSEAKYSCIKK